MITIFFFKEISFYNLARVSVGNILHSHEKGHDYLAWSMPAPVQWGVYTTLTSGLRATPPIHQSLRGWRTATPVHHLSGSALAPSPRVFPPGCWLGRARPIGCLPFPTAHGIPLPPSKPRTHIPALGSASGKPQCKTASHDLIRIQWLWGSGGGAATWHNQIPKH